MFNFLQELRSQKFYAGQIYRVAEIQGNNAKAMTCLEFIKKLKSEIDSEMVKFDLLGNIFSAAGLSELYSHQQRVIKRILGLRDTILASGVGSGRSTISDIMAIYRVLGFTDNVMVITPDPLSAKLRAEALNNTLKRLGFDYAIVVATLEESLRSNVSLPEIIVTTPPHIARMFEGKYTNTLDPEFFGCLKLFIMEDIHEFTGIYGGHVAALFRCLKVLLKRQSNEDTAVLATAIPFQNILSYASKLFDKNMEGSLIDEDGAEITKKKLIFWNSPLVRDDDTDKEFKRKDLRDDAQELLEFMSNYGLMGSTSQERRFCFLIDKSISMEAVEKTISESDSKFQITKNSILEDIRQKVSEGFFQKGDSLSFSFFDTKISTPLDPVLIEYPGQVDIEQISSKLNEINPGGGTDIAYALQNLLTEQSSGLAQSQVSRLVLFIYSDGEDSISQQNAENIRTIVEQITLNLNTPLDIFYISLGITPASSVSSLINMLGGKILVTGRESEGHLPVPSNIWKTSSVNDRPVVVVSFNDIFSHEEISSLRTGPRPVLLRPKISHPGLADYFPVDIAKQFATESDMSMSQFFVVTGWNGSPALLKHYINHMGKNDCCIFILGMADPLSQFNLRNWDQLFEEPVKDCITLNDFSSLIGAKTVRYFCRYNPLSLSDASYVIFGTWDRDPEDVRAALLKHHDIIISYSNTVISNRTGAEDALWNSFHVANKPVPVKLVGQEELLSLDKTSLLRNVIPGGTTTINGARYSVSLSNNENINLAPTTRFTWSFPKLEIAIKCPEENERASSRQSFLGSPLVSRKSIEVHAELKGLSKFEGGGFDKDPDQTEFPEHLTTSFKTDAIVLDYNETGLDQSCKTSIENLFWIFLGGLVSGEDRSCICLSEKEGDRIFIFDLVPDGGGLASAIEETEFELIISALKFAFYNLMGCPCEADTSLAAEIANRVGLQGSDSGCTFCLHAPTKIVGLPYTGGNKKQIIEFIGNSSVINGDGWRGRLDEKYSGVKEESRFYSSRGRYDAGYVNQIRRILADKLGIEFDDDQFVKARYVSAGEFSGESFAGLFNGKEVLIKPYPNEFTLLDILSHEYAHNWESVFWNESQKILRYYNIEDVEDQHNIPFLGKFFSEGSAMWIEAHVMDYYANRSVLSEVNLEILNEYWQGFRAMKYLEDEFGIRTVFNMLINGDFPDSRTSSFEDLYRESGVEGAIRQEGRKYIESGELACLGPGYLNKPDHIISISAFLADRTFPILTDIEGVKKLDNDSKKKIIPMISLKEVLTHFQDIRKTIESLGMNGLLDNDKAADMSVTIACHLHSNKDRSTSSLLEPLAKEIIKKL